MQGVGWVKRRIIKMGTLYLTIKHYTDDAGVEHIDILQSLSGLSDTDENRTFDWTPRMHDDDTFGKVWAKSQRVKVHHVQNDWLKNGWAPDTDEHGLVFTRAESKAEENGVNWMADQVSTNVSFDSAQLVLKSAADVGVRNDQRREEIRETRILPRPEGREAHPPSCVRL